MLAYAVCKSMDLTLSWKSVSCAATKIFLIFLRDPKVHCRVYKGPQLVSISSKINLVHTSSFYHSNIYPNVILPPQLDLLNGLFPSSIPTKIPYAFVFFMRAIFAANIIILELTILQVQVMKLHIIQFPLPVTSSLFGLNILSTPFSNVLSLCPFLNIRDKVSHPYIKPGKIIVRYILIFIFLCSRWDLGQLTGALRRADHPSKESSRLS
jgi:hypothetical protein